MAFATWISPEFQLYIIDVTVIEVTEEYLKEKLYKIRGKRVLLDADLAEIYGYDTKGFNRQVKIILKNLMKILCLN